LLFTRIEKIIRTSLGMFTYKEIVYVVIIFLKHSSHTSWWQVCGRPASRCGVVWVWVWVRGVGWGGGRLHQGLHLELLKALPSGKWAAWARRVPAVGQHPTDGGGGATGPGSGPTRTRQRPLRAGIIRVMRACSTPPLFLPSVWILPVAKSYPRAAHGSDARNLAGSHHDMRGAGSMEPCVWACDATRMRLGRDLGVTPT
jgi:hypothetical protein